MVAETVIQYGIPKDSKTKVCNTSATKSKRKLEPTVLEIIKNQAPVL